MKIALVALPHRDHQVRAMIAAGHGFRKHGHDVTMHNSIPAPRSADVVVTWGAGGSVEGPRLILEAGYINGNSGDYVADRLRFVSTSWNKPHGAGDFLGKVKRSRLKLLPPLQDWREDGEYCLVLEQHPNDLGAPPAGEWAAIVQRCRELAPTIVRPHPLVRRQPPLEHHLSGARFCVTWASTAAIESIFSGIPVVALGPHAIVAPVAGSTLDEEPPRPPRRKWAQELACRQWTHSELASGDFLEVIGCPVG